MPVQKLISEKNVFSVSHMGESKWQVQHHFEDPALEKDILQAEGDIGITIPAAIREFWSLSDGALLYKSLKAPDWSWRILSTKRYLENQHKWRRKYFDYWKMEYLVIAELVKPISAFVWNYQNGEVYYLDPSSRDMKEVKVADNLEDFFTKLYDSQGALFWQW